MNLKGAVSAAVVAGTGGDVTNDLNNEGMGMIGGQSLANMSIDLIDQFVFLGLSLSLSHTHTHSHALYTYVFLNCVVQVVISNVKLFLRIPRSVLYTVVCRWIMMALHG